MGAPAGAQSAPFAPLNAEGPSQAFEQPTPGDAAVEGGVRFQAPSPNPQMAGGFDLEGAEYNPFTAFRFPEVPGGADHQFTLRFQDTVITGQAGETRDLRQYAPNGLSTLSLRGDLTPFLSTADAPGPAIPLGGEPQLVFGLAFARPGIGSYTLRPVPEPDARTLAVLAVILLWSRFPRSRPCPRGCHVRRWRCRRRHFGGSRCRASLPPPGVLPWKGTDLRTVPSEVRGCHCEDDRVSVLLRPALLQNPVDILIVL